MALKQSSYSKKLMNIYLRAHGLGVRAKLIILFVAIKIVPLVLIALVAWNQAQRLGDELKERTTEIVSSAYSSLAETGKVAVDDTMVALDNRATQEIERLSTDTAQHVADFLYSQDAEILFASTLPVAEKDYRNFVFSKTRKVIKPGEWVLAENKDSWVRKDAHIEYERIVSSIKENNNRFNYRPPAPLEYESIPLFLEITFVDIQGNEKIKVTTSPLLSPRLANVSRRENTFIKAETYFAELQALKPGEIYVSEVIGEYVGSKIIGRYLPSAAEKAGIPFEPEKSAYAGQENPVGKKFQGLIRWATPVVRDGKKIGYVTLALDHRHVMQFTDRLMPTDKRYTELADAYEGNYAFIWDYKGRSIVHPRHFSIVGYDAETGDPQVPWLESQIYDAWQKSGLSYVDFIQTQPTFFEQSNSKKPAAELTRQGLVGLDCRYLNFAAQCTGWFDLTRDGGSGSFVILWSGLRKLNTAATIPYYTGRYGYSPRGFGFVAIGANVGDFHRPAKITEQALQSLLGAADTSLKTLAQAAYNSISNNLINTAMSLSASTLIMCVLVVFVAVWLASLITRKVTYIINGITKYREGQREFRFNGVFKDEIGSLADSFDEMADNLEAAENNSLVITDLDRKIRYGNAIGLNYIQKTLEEIKGCDYWGLSIFPPQSVYCPISALLKGEEAEVYYYRRINRYLKGVASYLRTRDGEAIGYIIRVTDVTQIVLEKMRIDEQRALLDTVFSASPDLIWYKDKDNRFIMVNPRFARIADLEPNDFIGKTVTEILPDSAAAVFSANDAKAVETGRVYYSEDSIPFIDGHTEVLDVVRTPLYTPQGEYSGLLGVARDVSARVEVEHALRLTQKELQKAVRTANEANASKSSFLARMSHEIRTPMNAIIGMGSIVSRKLQSPSVSVEEIQSHVRQIEISSQHLLGLINDILDISKIEAGKIELSYEAFDIAKLVSSVETIISPRCQEKNIDFIISVDPAMPDFLVSDILRLRQVLINLLGNAVKFTPETGTVSFAVNCLERTAFQAHIQFVVEDTGIGITPEMQQKIFLPFEQGDANITSTFGGTGLGLPISKNITELLNGSIEVTSTIGKGSSFTVSLWVPFSEQEAASDTVGTGERVCKGKRLLLVDDIDINRMIVVEQISYLEMAVEEAHNGQQAVDMIAASPEGYYDIVLMDVQMPVMNGYDASKVIRAMDRNDTRILSIVAMTANAFKEDIEQALAAGMTEHLAKPIQPEKLIDLLVRYVGYEADHDK